MQLTDYKHLTHQLWWPYQHHVLTGRQLPHPEQLLLRGEAVVCVLQQRLRQFQLLWYNYRLPESVMMLVKLLYMVVDMRFLPTIFYLSVIVYDSSRLASFSSTLNSS